MLFSSIVTDLHVWVTYLCSLNIPLTNISTDIITPNEITRAAATTIEHDVTARKVFFN